MGQRGPAPVFTSELRVNVRPDQRSAVAALADVSDVSLSAVVRAALDAFLRNDDPEGNRSWERERTN